MKDIIYAILLFIIVILGFNKMAKMEKEIHDKTLKNEIEKTKIIIEELKK